jgi:hypothetical protein
MGRVAAVHPDLGFETTTANNVRATRLCTLYMRYNPDAVHPSLRAEIIQHRQKGK